ncbi:MAG: hypothetical protein HXY34_04950 [Candidatus Thorarchaeota archaeon]|nr:hypothetical protein [Candidatus Thorarchaeota archaeon]
MDAWIKIVVVLMMLSLMGWVVGMFIYNPFAALILMGIILTFIVLTVDPATGKAMSQVIIPLILILFVFQVFWTGYSIEGQWWMLIAIGVVMYLLFTMFTNGAGMADGGALVDVKSSCVLFPIYAVMIVVAMIGDPTGRTAIFIMTGAIFLMMGISFFLLRGYKEWPEYQYGRTRGLVALTDINPRGKVKSGAEIWWAKTSGPPIKAGETVRMVRVSGLTMIVAHDDSAAESNSA